MEYKSLEDLIKEVVQEISATGTGAAMQPGTGEQVPTAKAFKKKNTKVQEIASGNKFSTGEDYTIGGKEVIYKWIRDNKYIFQTLDGKMIEIGDEDVDRVEKLSEAKDKEPKLAAGKVKHNYAVEKFGYKLAPSVPNRSSKAMDYKELWEGELKLGVKYNYKGESGFISTGGSQDPKNWKFLGDKQKYPYLAVKADLVPSEKQPGKYDGAFNLGMGKGHHIDEIDTNYKELWEQEITTVKDHPASLSSDPSKSITIPKGSKVKVIVKRMDNAPGVMQLDYNGTKVNVNAGPFINQYMHKPLSEGESGFNVNKVWDFIGSKPFYNKEYSPKFSTAQEIWDQWGPKEKEMYNNFQWTDTYNGETHPKEKAALQRRKNYDTLSKSSVNEEKLMPGDRVKVVYGNEFYGQTGTIEDIHRGFVEVEMDEDGGTYSMHMSDVEKIRDGVDNLDEGYIPSNIEEFAKRKYVLPLVKKIANWAEKAGKRINGGTAIGKNYSTLILDLTYQGGEIRINCDTEEIVVKGEPVENYNEFVDALGTEESLKEDYNYLTAGIPYKRETGQNSSGYNVEKITIVEPLPDSTKDNLIRRFRDAGWDAKPNNAGGITAVKRIEESINENYSHFRSETSKKTGPEQLHTAIKEIKKKILEINRLLEYTTRLREELTEGNGGEFKYKMHTERALEQITEMIKHTYIKTKKLK